MKTVTIKLEDEVAAMVLQDGCTLEESTVLLIKTHLAQVYQEEAHRLIDELLTMPGICLGCSAELLMDVVEQLTEGVEKTKDHLHPGSGDPGRN